MNLSPLRTRFRPPARALLLAALSACWLPHVGAQVTSYTDEAGFNAATAQLNFLLETFEGIAPAGQNGYPANLVSPGADIFSPFSVSNADVYTTSTPQGLEVDDAAFNKLSLNGSACLTVLTPLHLPFKVTMTTDNAANTAFGTAFGFRNPFGGSVFSAPGGGGPPGGYPLTDTVDVRLYLYNEYDLSTTPVGSVFHAGTVANGYLGFVSTQPFNRVEFTFNHFQDYYDNGGYLIEDPYQMTWDNVRFGAAPTLPTVTVVGGSPDANAATGQAGAFVLTLSAAAATDLKVAYTLKGSAANGADYALLKGTVKIKAGKTSKSLAVVPQGMATGGAKKVVKLTLAPGTGYLIGTPGPVKVKIAEVP